MHSMFRTPFFIPFLALLLLTASLMPGATVGRADELPPQVRVVLAKVSLLFEKKQYNKAIEIIESFQVKGGSALHPELFFALGNCYLLQNRYPAAVQAYTQTVTNDPRHTHGWLNLAKAYYELKQYKEAGRCFEQGYTSESEKHPEKLYYSAAAYLMAGAHQQSVATFKRLQAAHPGSLQAEWKEQYIHALLGAGQNKRALPLIRELAALYSGDQRSQWQEMLLYQYVQLNMYPEALAYGRGLTEQNPQVAKWWKALVHIQLSGNHLQEALAALTLYGYLTPLTAKENKLLADLYLQVGIPAKAAPIYAERLKTESDGQLLQRLAIAYYQMGQPETALQSLARFKGLADNPRLLMLQGELCYGLKRYGDAAASYRQAARGNGSSTGQAWLMAGYAALQLHDIAGSREAFTRAARYDREKKAATVALNQLQQMAVQSQSSEDSYTRR